MPKIAFARHKFAGTTSSVVQHCDDVITEYQAQGYVLTLRQLYYVFIGRDLFPSDWIDVEYNRREGLPDDTKNTPKNYKRFGGIVSDARLAGLLDWDAIEDRGRQPSTPLEFQDLNHRVRSALANYRLPRWADQSHYVELWVEKDALAGVLQPLAHEHHITLCVNKGYSSQSAMYVAAQRFNEAAGVDEDELQRRIDEELDPGSVCYGEELDPGSYAGSGKRLVLFYLGDHDPSGEDMVRDIRTRLHTFGVRDLRVEKIALTTAQVKQYKPPPNPAKVTDPRAKAYIKEHGPKSWEVDALAPPILRQLITSAIESVTDGKQLARVLTREKTDKERLQKAVASLGGEP